MASIDKSKVIKILANDSLFAKSWKLFCKELEFSQNNISELERMSNSNAPLTDIIIQIMSTWKSTSPADANPKTLSQKLRDIDCNKCADDVDSLFGSSVGSTDSADEGSKKEGKVTPSAAELIANNLQYLTEKLSNILIVLTCLVANGVITVPEKNRVNSHRTEEEKSDELFSILLRKELDKNNGLQLLISTFENTGNAHLADKLKTS